MRSLYKQAARADFLRPPLLWTVVGQMVPRVADVAPAGVAAAAAPSGPAVSVVVVSVTVLTPAVSVGGAAVASTSASTPFLLGCLLPVLIFFLSLDRTLEALSLSTLAHRVVFFETSRNTAPVRVADMELSCLLVEVVGQACQCPDGCRDRRSHAAPCKGW